MIKTLSQALRMDKERFKVPKSVQQAIPIQRIWPDGIFQQGTKFSKTYRFTDINYYIASKDNKTEMFLDYSELLNSLDSGISAKITINNRRINKEEFEKSILLPMKEDGLDHYREEYNEMLLSKITGTNNSIYQERYLTVSVHKRSIDDARTYFARIGTDIVTHLAKLSSTAEGLDAESRLQIFRDFFKGDVPQAFPFDLKQFAKKGTSFKDWMCPDSMEFERDHFKIGDRYGRVLYMQDYASYVKDDMISELCDFSRNLILSIDILPVPTDEAVREIQNRLLGVETNVTNWQRRQNANNNFSAEVPYDLEMQRQELREFLDDLSSRDQKMMLSVLTIVITADTLEELNQQTKSMQELARERVSQIAVLKFQQLDGLHTVLPAGMQKLDIFRTLITESLAIQIPFRVQEIAHAKGIFYGQNVISKNMILADRTQLLNGNSFILGVSGSGKSFAAKCEITNHMLATDADILIIDPEREYAPLVRALGGEVIEISATSQNHINAMDMTKEYGEINPIIEKSQFLQSLCEQIIAGHTFTKGQQSIIDRCTALVYPEAEKAGRVATLCDLRQKLLEQPEDKAKEIALSLELYTTGSLDIFGRESTVDLNKPYVVFDIHGLGEQLKPAGSLVITDTILNRVTLNWKRGKRTHVFIDEFHVMFENEQSGIFFNSAWRQFRKRGAYPTAITQNVEYLLDSVQASTMLSNSEFIVMLNQAASDRAKLAKLLNISNEQMSYVTNADAGCGLIRYGSALVPFINRFPRDTKLYALMTTKPGEGVFGGEEVLV